MLHRFIPIYSTQNVRTIMTGQCVRSGIVITTSKTINIQGLGVANVSFGRAGFPPASLTRCTRMPQDRFYRDSKEKSPSDVLTLVRGALLRPHCKVKRLVAIGRVRSVQRPGEHPTAWRRHSPQRVTRADRERCGARRVPTQADSRTAESEVENLFLCGSCVAVFRFT